MGIGSWSAKDQRRFRRFRVQDGGLVRMRSSPEKVGQLIDASKGGLSFVSLAEPHSAHPFQAIDLMFINRAFLLDRISVTVIYTQRLDAHWANPNIRVLRTGVEFRDLTRYQQHNIEHFLQDYTAASPA